MAWNNVIEGIFTGQSEFTVTFDAAPEPPPEPTPAGRTRGKTFLWTVHPKRRMHAFVDTRRKRRPFRALSANSNDFRAWRRIVEYGKTIIKSLLRCEMTYGEIKATKLTYADMKATGMTYAQMRECGTVIT